MNKLRQFWQSFLLLIFRVRPASPDGDAASRITESGPPVDAPTSVGVEQHSGQGWQDRTQFVEPRHARSEPIEAQVEPTETTKPHQPTRPRESPPVEMRPPSARETAAPREARDAPPAQEIESQINRHQRRQLDKWERMHRRLERARMKRDKLVMPKGPEPAKRTRNAVPAPPPLAAALPVVQVPTDPNDRIIADELIEGDGQGNVLFEQSEFWGEFNFRDSILDQLDRYWVYLERMRARDPDAYGFYKAIGATLIPYSSKHINRKFQISHGRKAPEEIDEWKRGIYISPWFHENRPSFGCISVGTDPLTELAEQGKGLNASGEKVYLPKFTYFVKYDRPPPEIQPVRDGDVYKVTIWWDEPWDKKWKKGGGPCEFGVHLSTDGKSIRILRLLDTKMIKVSRKNNNRDFHLIPRREWRIPGFYKEWAKDHGLTAQLFLAHMFSQVVSDFERSNLSMIRVNVARGDLTAVFGVNAQRVPSFFRDRDVTLTDAGFKEPVFHFVRPHLRADGTAVKAHFRGRREFDWAGCHVLITVPGKDHPLLSDCGIAVTDEYWINKRDRKQWMHEPEFGELLARIVRGEKRV